MSACEMCWKAAAFRAMVLGDSTAHHYTVIMTEQEKNPTCPGWKNEARDERD